MHSRLPSAAPGSPPSHISQGRACAAAQALKLTLSYLPPNSLGDALTRVFAFGGASLDHQPGAPIAYFLMFQAQQPAVGVTNAKLDATAADLAGAGPMMRAQALWLPSVCFLMFQAQQLAVGVTNAKLDALAADLADCGPADIACQSFAANLWCMCSSWPCIKRPCTWRC